MDLLDVEDGIRTRMAFAESDRGGHFPAAAEQSDVSRAVWLNE